MNTALAALAARQGVGVASLAELESQVEELVAQWGAKIQALGATVRPRPTAPRVRTVTVPRCRAACRAAACAPLTRWPPHSASTSAS